MILAMISMFFSFSHSCILAAGIDNIKTWMQLIVIVGCIDSSTEVIAS